MNKIHLSFTPIESDKFLAVTCGDSDIPIGVVVDGEIKKVLEVFQKLYNEHPKALVTLIKNHYKGIISAAHKYRNDAFEPSWKTVPLIGLRSEKEVEQGLMEVEYVENGTAARLMHGYVDSELYTALKAIADDYIANPVMYYQFLTQEKNNFLVKLLKKVL